MGLDTTHNAYHGSYSGFNDWRKAVAAIIGVKLEQMEGFSLKRWGTDDNAPAIKWDSLEPRPLIELLRHSDCDGEIGWERCESLAEDLESILPALADVSTTWDNPHDTAEQFIAGLRAAFAAKENLKFQ